MILTNKVRTQNNTKVVFNAFISKKQQANFILVCTPYAVGENGNKITKIKSNWFENTERNETKILKKLKTSMKSLG